MKKIYSSSVLIAICMLFAITSCTSSKKMAISCPEPADNYRSKVVTKRHFKTRALFAQDKKKNQWDYSKRRNIANAKPNKSVKLVQSSRIEEISSEIANGIAINSSEYFDNLYASSVIISEALPETSTLSVPKYEVILENERSVPLYRKIETIPLKSAVSSEIAFIDHTEALLSPSLSIPNSNQEEIGSERKTDGMGIAGFVVSLAGLLILPIPCGIVGIVLSAISLGRIMKNPNKLKGQGFAIAGLSVGIVVLVLGIVLLAAVL